MKSTYLRKQPLALAVTLAAGLSGTSYAQTGPALEEVIVTAQKREQSMQDVPVAVTAFSGEALERAGTETIVELQKTAPNTTLQVSRGTNSTLTAYIRGVGQQDPLWGFEPGVGLYVDDVYLARPQGGVLDVYDVERVEILRGPQGTLYGKNTIGGAIKYVTKRMGNEPSLTIDSTVGTYNQRDLKVSGSLPLIDNTLYLGGSVVSLNRDGYGNFLSPEGKPEAENYNKDLFAGRVSLEYTPTSNIFVRLAADKTRDTSNAKGGHRLTQSVLVPSEPIPDSVYDSYANMSTDNLVENEGASLTVEWTLSDAMSVKSITAYREGFTDTNIDFDNTSFSSVHVPAVYEDDQFTQEIQLNYSADKWNLVSGVYYYDGTASGAFDVLLGAFDPAPGQNFTASTAGSMDTISYAAYANVGIDLTDRLTLTLGGRYNIDKKEGEVYKFLGLVDDRSELTGGETLGVIAVQTDYTNDKSWKEFTPRVSLDYRLTDNLMTYVSYSEGFKSGGFDMRGDATANPDTVEGFDPESVKTYETGIKSELWDNRLRLNAAAFYSDYTDMQVTVQEAVDGGANFVSGVFNAGESEIRGFEVEATAQLTERFSAMMNFGYIDADFKSVITQTAEGRQDLSDVWEFSNTPETTGQVRVNYDYSLGDRGRLTLWTALSHRADTRMFEAAESLIDERSYMLWDASAIWYSPSETWTVGLHGKNLADEQYRVAGYNFPSLGAEEIIVGYYGDPRTVGLNVRYRF
jgi:iron complex outermembrane receptor protein